MKRPDPRPRSGRKRSRAEGGRRKRLPRGRALKRTAALVFALLVVFAAGWLYLWVEVGRRFEGRLWDFPSRVYSDGLVLVPGSIATPPAIARRLDRSGFVRVDGSPSSPGQYRRRGDRIEVHLRSSSGASSPAARRVIVRFDGGSVQSIEGDGGRAIPRLELEPELLALLSGPQQEEREVVRLEDVPKRLVDGVLAAEDSRFYSHPGVDPIAILRALFADVRSARIVQGGSTITQQTVKNLYLGQERTWWRKFREALLAVVLDARYSKDRILEVYLNEVYLGQRGSVAVCGFASAARFYFGKDLADLTLGDCALLAGLVRNPGGYNPFSHLEQAIGRRDQVLRAMLDDRRIREAEAEAARAERPRLASGKQGYSSAPYVVDLVRSQLADLYTPTQLAREGLRIHTTLDTTLQEAAQEALRAGLERLDRERRGAAAKDGGRKLEGCALVLRPSTGAVLALVGGRDYAGSQFNRAVQARRQAGSCFKPFVYLAGFESAIRGREGGLTAATILDDSPLEIPSGGRTWRPANYDGEFRGPVTARQALEQSLNVPTARAAMRVGLKEVVRTAARCGLGNLEPYPSLALGAQEITPLDLAAAFGVLANEGKRSDPAIVREVTSREGEPLTRKGKDPVQVVTPQAAWLVTDVLRGVLSRGTAASSAALGFRGNAAGKTGTTDDTRDAWFVGYTPDLLALVWVGYDDNARTGLTGASGALPIWVDLLRRAGRFTDAPFPEPDGIVRAVVDPESGGLAVAGCPARVEEVFAAGTEPVDGCALHAKGLGGWLRRIFRRK